MFDFDGNKSYCTLNMNLYQYFNQCDNIKEA